MPSWVEVVMDGAVDALLLREAFLEAAPQVLVTVSVSGEDALRVLRAAASRGQLPSLVVTDYGLPGMSGSDLVAALRADPSLRTTRVVIFAGGSTAVRLAQRDDWMEKPTEWSGWVATARRLFGTGAAADAVLPR